MTLSLPWPPQCPTPPSHFATGGGLVRLTLLLRLLRPDLILAYHHTLGSGAKFSEGGCARRRSPGERAEAVGNSHLAKFTTSPVGSTAADSEVVAWSGYPQVVDLVRREAIARCCEKAQHFFSRKTHCGADGFGSWLCRNAGAHKELRTILLRIVNGGTSVLKTVSPNSRPERLQQWALIVSQSEMLNAPREQSTSSSEARDSFPSFRVGLRGSHSQAACSGASAS